MRYRVALASLIVAFVGIGLLYPGATTRAQDSGSFSLSPGCNNVALTWPNGTPASTVAAAVSDGANLLAIWRYDAAAQRFLGYAPIPNAPNDLTTVSALEAVFVCVTNSGTLARPAVGGSGGGSSSGGGVSLSSCSAPNASAPLDALDQQMLDALNAYRAQLRLPPYTPSPTLMRMARWKAAVLAQRATGTVDTSNHNLPGLPWDPGQLDLCGYPSSAGAAENLGATNATIPILVTAWQNSPTHDANLRMGELTFIGIGHAIAGDGQTVWVTEFGDSAQ